MLVCFNLVIFGLADWLEDATRGWCMLGREEAVEEDWVCLEVDEVGMTRDRRVGREPP